MSLTIRHQDPLSLSLLRARPHCRGLISGKLKAEEISGKKKALGLDHISTLNLVNNLRNLYSKIREASRGWERA